MKGLKPLQGSKKLQYVALLAAQRCHVLDMKTTSDSFRLFNKAAESFLLFNTNAISGKQQKTSINKCKEIGVELASYLYDSRMLLATENEENGLYDENWAVSAQIRHVETYSSMGCAVSIVNSTSCQVCYYQGDKGADKLKLDIVPTWVNIDLVSYNDSFWTQFNF